MRESMAALVTIVDREKGEEVAEFCLENGVNYNFLTLARGTVHSELMTLLGLGEIDKDMILSVLPRAAVKTHLAGLSGLLKLKRPGAGVAFSMPLLALNALVAQCILTSLPQEPEEGPAEKTDRNVEAKAAGKTDAEQAANPAPAPEAKKDGKRMATKFSLILVIAESGYSDQVMEAAKSAGATGGTLLHARGVGREEDGTIAGAPLQTEKEIVLILAGQHNQRGIMDAVNKSCGLLTEAKGIVLALPVEEIAGIG